MPFYVVAQRCGGCETWPCFDCRRQERSLKLLRVFSETEPAHVVYGPCDDFRDILNDRMWRLFQFNDETQELFFKVKP